MAHPAPIPERMTAIFPLSPLEPAVPAVLTGAVRNKANRWSDRWRFPAGNCNAFPPERGPGGVKEVASSVIGYLENTSADTILNVLPLSSGYGLYQPLMTFTFGGTLILESSFAYPAATIEKISQESVTGLPGVPTMFAALLQMDLARYDLTSLRYISNAAAALPPIHIEQLGRRLPHVKIYSMYGLTETKRALYLPPDQVAARPASVGVAIPGTEVWIAGPDGERLGANQVGKASINGWRDVLTHALLNRTSTLWPFDGPLGSLLKPGHTVIVETYPAEYYGWFFQKRLPIRKTRMDARQQVAPALLNWAGSANVMLAPDLQRAIQGGFPQGDDAFDAVVGLFGMMEVLMHRRSPREPAGDTVRQVEGWIFGQAGAP